MLGKLMKYDLKNLLKKVAPVYLVILGFTILRKGFELLAPMAILKGGIAGFVAPFIIFGYIVALVVLWVWTFVAILQYFYKNITKDEGYLTHTLPVSKTNLLLSKELSSGIVVLLTAIVFCISMFIMMYPHHMDFIESMQRLFGWNGLSDFRIVSMLIQITVTILISLFVTLTIYFLGILFGQTRNSHRVLYAIGFVFLIDMVLNLVETGIAFVIVVLDPSISLNSTYETFGEMYSYMQSLLTAQGVWGVIVLIVGFILSVKIMEKRLNLE